MTKKLFLLDGMALIYRAHFAFVSRPILTSQGVNTSALYGFTQTLLDIRDRLLPTHLAVAFDTAEPTRRHTEYPEYKANRQEMPEDLSLALPHARRMCEALRIPVLLGNGFEADDIIGTLVTRAEKEGFESYMVTPDKDFGQLVSASTFIYKPGRKANESEILGVPEILARWGIQNPSQVVDILALMGDASDNIPGVPGVGEKTAMKLIAQFGSVENLLAKSSEIKGKIRESIEKNREAAVLSKRLALIDRDVPCCEAGLESLIVQSPDDEGLKALFAEFEFNSISDRLFGKSSTGGKAAPAGKPAAQENLEFRLESDPVPVAAPAPQAASPTPEPSNLKSIRQVPHDYQLVRTEPERKVLIQKLHAQGSFCFDTETTGLDPFKDHLVGIAFSIAPHTGYYVPVPQDAAESARLLEEFRPLFENEDLEKTGHNLKFDVGMLQRHSIAVRGRLFDTMIAHSLMEPDQRHGMDFLSEVYLGYTPIPITQLIGEEKQPQKNMAEVPVEQVAEYSAEDADVTWQLRNMFKPLLHEKCQDRVFYDIEAPLLPVLVDMELEGIRVDAAALSVFAEQLAKEMAGQEEAIQKLAGTPFNVNSPRQLGQILFDVLKIADAPKKTRTGQYATDEQTLASLSTEHEIVRRLLDYRTAAKLKSTYADALPAAIRAETGRVHTTYSQAMTTTGRLSSQNPNLQNIPIRTERGREIRRAFVPRDSQWLILSADYSQIELRIIAALSREPALLEAFRTGADVHTATAARVYNVFPEMVTPEMRGKAKMVNYGIAYGISAFGLSQRLHIPRKEAAEIIDQYYKQFPGIRTFMDGTVAFAREHGYVETVTGRRRYLRDIASANNSVRGGAERNAINAPIQGAAADMIKIAMTRVHGELARRKLRTRLLLQVHDELVFDLWPAEEVEVRELVRDKMTTALLLEVPIEVEIGVGQNWLEAH